MQTFTVSTDVSKIIIFGSRVTKFKNVASCIKQFVRIFVRLCYECMYDTPIINRSCMTEYRYAGSNL